MHVVVGVGRRRCTIEWCAQRGTGSWGVSVVGGHDRIHHTEPPALGAGVGRLHGLIGRVFSLCGERREHTTRNVSVPVGLVGRYCLIVINVVICGVPLAVVACSIKGTSPSVNCCVYRESSS